MISFPAVKTLLLFGILLQLAAHLHGPSLGQNPSILPAVRNSWHPKPGPLQQQQQQEQEHPHCMNPQNPPDNRAAGYHGRQVKAQTAVQ
ncbi:hypothetical protein VTJ04DRAFT_2334 [Mycothermus thermophilus]|uniref:uncharacterized protein n=1 Tax=Humicola insolens TaxID=85995 RepID=UPI0037444173